MPLPARNWLPAGETATAKPELARGGRNRDRQRVGAYQPPIPLRQPAAHAAHQAEAAEQADGAVNQADAEAGEDDELGGRLHDQGFRITRSRDEPATAT